MTANFVSVAIILVSAIVLYGIFFLTYDYMDWFSASAMESFSEKSDLLFRKFMILLIVGTVVHELIHGLTWGLLAKSKFKSISFGVMWKKLTPYCHCSEPLKVPHYAIGSLTPLVTLGLIPAIVAICFKSLFWLTLGIVFIGAAAGDIMVVWKLRKEKRDNMVLDHPSEAGYLVYEEE